MWGGVSGPQPTCQDGQNSSQVGFLSCRCFNTVPKPGGLRQHKCIASWFWKPEDQSQSVTEPVGENQSLSLSSSWGLGCSLTQGCLAPVCLHRHADSSCPICL